MAASSRDKDFVHQLQQKLNCKVDVCNYYQWEVMAHDRAETYSLLDRFLGNRYDLVIVQLGENISNIDTLEKDFVDFVKFLKIKQSQARIIIVGNFWNNEKVNSIKRDICNGQGIVYIDIGDLDSEKYYCGIGMMVSGDDGIMHKVLHGGVARHPGDKAMAEIAERIVRVLK